MPTNHVIFVFLLQKLGLFKSILLNLRQIKKDACYINTWSRLFNTESDEAAEYQH